MTERQSDRHNSPVNDKPPVFRSMSLADVTDDINEFKKSQLDGKASLNDHSYQQASEINTHPENYVILDGQKVKVKRTTYYNDNHTLASSLDTLDTSKAFFGAKTDNDLNVVEGGSSLALLNRALQDSDALVMKQTQELKMAACRIEELESFITALNLDQASLSRVKLSDKDLAKDTKQFAFGVKASSSVSTTNEIPGRSIQTKQSLQSSELSVVNEDDLVSTHLVVDEQQPLKRMPNKLAARLALGSNERRKLTSNCLSVNNGESRNETPSGELLRGRKRVDDSDKSSVGSHTSTSAASRDTSPGPKPIFEWKTRATTSVCVFIAHDNPQISKTVATQLNKSSFIGANSSSKATNGSSSGSGMQIMMESKGHAQNDLTHFLIGDIIYSGDYAHVQDAVLSNSRGSECLVVTNMRAVRHPVKQFKTRDSNTNKEVIEINLVDVPSASIVDVSSDSKLADFLSSCQARVDCILDPYHSQHTWYPYYEGSSASSAATHRKMAPQFRSQGIGYIRLGDDMSNFGVAFVSLDAGATYLDNGATSIVDSTGGVNTKTYNNKSNMNLMATFPGNGLNNMSSFNLLASSTLQPGSLSSLLTTDAALSRKSSRLNIRSVVNSSRSGLDDEADIAPRDTQVFSKHIQFDAMHEVLQALKESNIKWSQRTERLNSLQLILADVSAASSVQMTETKNKSLVLELMGVLLDQLTTQKNPHVSIATLQCIGTLTYGELLATHYAVSWRALMVETAHMLRNNNKQIFETVVSAMGSLYRSRALSFAYLSGGGGSVLLDILNGPRSSGGGGSKANNPSSNGTSTTLHGGSNIVKVTGWLDSAARGDLETCGRHIASLESGGVVNPTSSAVFSIMKSAYQSATAKLLTRLTPLLSHREEASRESVIGLCAAYLVLFFQFKSLTQSEFLGVSTLLSTATQSDAEGGVRDALWRLLSDEEICTALEGIEKSAIRSFEKLLVTTVQFVARHATDMSTYLAESTAAALRATSSASNGSRATSSSSVVRKDNANSDGKSIPGLLSRANSAVQKARRPSSNTSTTSGVTTADGSLCSAESPSDESDVHVFRPFNAETDLRCSPRLSPRQQTDTSSTNTSESTGSTVSRAMPRSSSRSKFNRGAIKQPPTSNAVSPNNTDALSSSWFEAKLLLTRVPENDNAWCHLCEVVRSSPSFFSSLSSAALSLSCPVGLVLRAVLPFDEETSSADQAAGNCSGSSSSRGINAVNKLLTGQGGRGSDSLSVNHSEMEHTLNALRTQATDIRSLVRVKMADEADLKQALMAVTMLRSFVDQLELQCGRSNSTMTAVILKLDS